MCSREKAKPGSAIAQKAAARAHPLVVGGPEYRQRHLVSRLHADARCPVLGTPVPYVQCQRRLQPRVAEDQDRQQSAITARDPCLGRIGRAAQCAMVPASGQRSGVHQHRAETDPYVFTILDEVRDLTGDWRYRYNQHRPHGTQGWRSPVRYAMAQSQSTSIFD